MQKGLQTAVHRITLVNHDDTEVVFETVNAIDAFGKYEHTTLPDLLAEVGRYAGHGASTTLASNQNIGAMIYDVLHPTALPVVLIQVSIKILGRNALRWAATEFLNVEQGQSHNPLRDPGLLLEMLKEVKGTSCTKPNPQGEYIVSDFVSKDFGVAVARAYISSQLPDGITTTRVPLDLYEQDQKEAPEAPPED